MYRCAIGGGVERHRRLDLPDVAVGSGVFAGASGPVVGGMGGQLGADLEPVAALLELLREGVVRIGLE
jgi:hypothetical protein